MYIVRREQQLFTYQHGKAAMLDFRLTVVEEELIIVGKGERIESYISRHRPIQQGVLVEKGDGLGLFRRNVRHAEGRCLDRRLSGGAGKRVGACKEGNEGCCGDLHGFSGEMSTGCLIGFFVSLSCDLCVTSSGTDVVKLRSYSASLFTGSHTYRPYSTFHTVEQNGTNVQ